MKKKRYLYYENNSGVYRAIVTRESEKWIWVKPSENSMDIKLSKSETYNGKIYYRSSTYKTIIYSDETPELLERYKHTILKRHYKEIIEELNVCKDVDVMKRTLKKLETDKLLKENKKLRAQNVKAANAIEVLLKNRDLGEYESQKQGLPRMAEVNEIARAVLKEIRGIKK